MALRRSNCKRMSLTILVEAEEEELIYIGKAGTNLRTQLLAILVQIIRRPFAKNKIEDCYF